MAQDSSILKRLILGAFLPALIAVFLVGCAGGRTEYARDHTAGESRPRPPAVLVYNFAVDAEDVALDTMGLNSRGKGSTSERQRGGAAYANALSDKLVTKLTGKGIPARRATVSAQVPMHAIVVKGQFVSIEEGDQIKRTMIGFGAGAESVRARVQVYQMTKGGLQRISESEAEAFGRKTPGMAGPAAVAGLTGQVVGVVVAGGMNLKSEAVDGSMETTVNNLADQFVGRAVKFYKNQGWL